MAAIRFHMLALDSFIAVFVSYFVISCCRDLNTDSLKHSFESVLSTGFEH
jgi:hypothetical protein